jgi:S-adenosylhomocysteine hydrolase
VINDSPLKQIVENKHAVGQGAVESLMRGDERVMRTRVSVGTRAELRTN